MRGRRPRVTAVPTVRPATDADLPAIGRVLAAAFATDPVWQWLASPRVDFASRAAAWFSAEAKAQLRGHGEVLVDDQVRGVAIWAPPGRWRSSTLEGLGLIVPSVRLFGRGLPRAMRMLGALEGAHPDAEHHPPVRHLVEGGPHQEVGESFGTVSPDTASAPTSVVVPSRTRLSTNCSVM